MKTPVTVLQELLVGMHDSPEYECIAQSGPAHSAVFQCRCAARGHVVVGAARSKREAKQESARVMLAALSAAGVRVPPPYATSAPAASASPSAPPPPPPPPRTHVALLKELCEEYRLGAPDYQLVGDTGPAHLRHFTMRACVGQHERAATATTKKQARQLAAEQLYTYLREHLGRLTQDFVEEDALARAYEKVIERYTELREDSAWRPDLGQRIADYHLGLVTHTDVEKVQRGREAVARGGAAGVDEAAAALGLALEWGSLPAEEEGAPLHTLSLSPSAPPLSVAARDRPAAAAAMLRALRLLLHP